MVTTFLWTAQTVKTCASAIPTKMNCILMPSILISTKNFYLIGRQTFLVPITEINILGLGDTPSMKDLSTFLEYLGLSIYWLQIGRVMANFKKVDGESTTIMLRRLSKYDLGVRIGGTSQSRDRGYHRGHYANASAVSQRISADNGALNSSALLNPWEQIWQEPMRRRRAAFRPT